MKCLFVGYPKARTKQPNVRVEVLDTGNRHQLRASYLDGDEREHAAVLDEMLVVNLLIRRAVLLCEFVPAEKIIDAIRNIEDVAGHLFARPLSAGVAEVSNDAAR